MIPKDIRMTIVRDLKMKRGMYQNLAPLNPVNFLDLFTSSAEDTLLRTR